MFPAALPALDHVTALCAETDQLVAHLSNIIAYHINVTTRHVSMLTETRASSRKEQHDESTDLRRAVVFPGEQILAKVNADGEVLVSGVDLGFETLVVVHEQLDAADVTRLLLRLHLQDHVAHPQLQIAHHAKEPARSHMQPVLD